MARWDTSETSRHVRRLYGQTQSDIVRLSLSSIRERQGFARCHFREYQRLYSENIDAKLSTASIYEITFPLGPEELAEWDSWVTCANANIVACLQSLHSQADILAHVVYFALGLNLGAGALKEHAIYLGKVTPLVVDSALRKRLEGIKGHPDFTYLAAVVNRSKHRSIIGTVLSVDAPTQGSAPYTLSFESFTHGGVPHAERAVAPYLERVYAWLNTEIVSCGRELNQAIGP